MKRRLAWKPKSENQYEIIVEEQDPETGKWKDVSQNYQVNSKKYGKVYIFSLKEFQPVEVDGENGEKLLFHNLHILNPTTNEFEPISILASHTYYKKAVQGLAERGQLIFVMGTIAEKVKKEGNKFQSVVLYTIVPSSEKLTNKLLKLPHKQAYIVEVVDEDDVELNLTVGAQTE